MASCSPSLVRSLAFAALLALPGCLAHQAASAAGGVTLRPEHEEPELVSVRHRVEKGQTLYRIARTYGLSLEELAGANGIDDPAAISVGQELVVPGAAKVLPVEATVPGSEPVVLGPEAPFGPHPPTGGPAAPTVSPGKASAGPRSTVALPRGLPGEGTVRALPSARQPLLGSPSSSGLRWPIRGVLYARFGKKGREMHDGIDLAAPEGSPVATAAPGKVLFAGEQRGYGLLAIIEHGRGLVTLYAHNKDLRVRTGQVVRSGQVIATVGESGRTSGPHLHFEIRKDGVPVDPLRHLGPVPPMARSSDGR